MTTCDYVFALSVSVFVCVLLRAFRPRKQSQPHTAPHSDTLRHTVTQPYPPSQHNMGVSLCHCVRLHNDTVTRYVAVTVSDGEVSLSVCL